MQGRVAIRGESAETGLTTMNFLILRDSPLGLDKLC